MCGRFTLAIDVEGLVEWFPMELGNIAPTQEVLTYVADGGLSSCLWKNGIMPHRMYSPTPGPRSTFNVQTPALPILADS